MKDEHAPALTPHEDIVPPIRADTVANAVGPIRLITHTTRTTVGRRRQRANPQSPRKTKRKGRSLLPKRRR